MGVAMVLVGIDAGSVRAFALASKGVIYQRQNFPDEGDGRLLKQGLAILCLFNTKNRNVRKKNLFEYFRDRFLGQLSAKNAKM